MSRSPWSKAQEKARRRKLFDGRRPKQPRGRGDWEDEPVTRCRRCHKLAWLTLEPPCIAGLCSACLAPPPIIRKSFLAAQAAAQQQPTDPEISTPNPQS